MHWCIFQAQLLSCTRCISILCTNVRTLGLALASGGLLAIFQGIIHRDLKGNNIFCCKGGILKLGDFGISKVLTPQARAARTMIGTPYYM